MKQFSLLILFCLSAVAVNAQRFVWDIDFETTFDNREGINDVVPTETYFFINLAPEIGVDLGSSGRVSGGIVWTQHIGNEWDKHNISPTLYYRYKGDEWKVSAGIFPRRQLTEQLPAFLWSDSLNYFQKNIRGVLAQYTRGGSFADFYLDWRQMRSRTKREAFNIVVHGLWRPDISTIWGIGGHAMMNHFARRIDAPDTEHIVDNFLANPYFRIDLDGLCALDILSFRTGLLANIERNRELGGWDFAPGFWLEGVMEWRWLGVKNSFYAGKPLLPSYGLFGSELYQADPFYAKRIYNRTDLYGHLLRRKFVRLDAELNFHFTPGSFVFYQRLMLRVDINHSNTTRPSRNPETI